MDTVTYYLGRGLFWVLQHLSLRWLARLGRVLGLIAWRLDARHRRVAQANLQLAFGSEKSLSEIRAIVRENYCRLGEVVLCSARTAVMDHAQLRQCIVVVGLEKLLGRPSEPRRSRILALGHFGNFELFAHGTKYLPGWQMITTYRALNQPGLNRLVQERRLQAGCLAFERRHERKLLQEALRSGPVMLGLLSDQSAGNSGLWLPFLGTPCSTTRAPAIMAIRHQMPLHAAICYRVGLGNWQVEISDEIPTHDGRQQRTTADIMRDVNRVFEDAVRRDPANWYWLHRRWKQPPVKADAGPPRG